MGKIITYKDEGTKGVYSQIKLKSNDRVLISIGDGVVKIYKLGFRGLIPTSTIWGPRDIAATSMIVFDKEKPTKSLLEAIINCISDCDSIRDVRNRLASRESSRKQQYAR